jgi:hypothetical protein
MWKSQPDQEMTGIQLFRVIITAWKVVWAGFASRRHFLSIPALPVHWTGDLTG